MTTENYALRVLTMWQEGVEFDVYGWHIVAWVEDESISLPPELDKVRIVCRVAPRFQPE
jgi:hypothetical protein